MKKNPRLWTAAFSASIKVSQLCIINNTSHHVRWFLRSYKKLQDVRRRYKKLQDVTKRYKKLQDVTRCYKTKDVTRRKTSEDVKACLKDVTWEREIKSVWFAQETNSLLTLYTFLTIKRHRIITTSRQNYVEVVKKPVVTYMHAR